MKCLGVMPKRDLKLLSSVLSEILNCSVILLIVIDLSFTIIFLIYIFIPNKKTIVSSE